MAFEFDKKPDRTQAWERYELGCSYNNRLVPNQYTLVDSNIEFYAGNQWIHLPQSEAMSRLPKPVFNIIKRVTNVQVANLMSSGISVHIEPLSYYDGSSVADPDSTACAFAQAEINNLFEKFRIEYRAREALFDAAITGDMVAHFWFDPSKEPYGGRLGRQAKGEICMELVDGVNVIFGNPNCRNVEDQPYILILGRDTVANLREERAFYMKDDQVILPDSDTQYQSGIGGKTELDGADDTAKASYVYMYHKVTKEVDAVDENGDPIMDPVLKKNGEPVYETDANGNAVLDSYGVPVVKLKKRREMKTTVHVSKSTRDADIFKDIDMGMTVYPISFGNWEKQKNQYHGRALVTGIIPNQIFINTLFAMVMRYVQINAFPKRVYNADLIPHWTNEIGVDIAVHGMMPGQQINTVATELRGMELNQQILYVIDKAMEMTKDCLGSTDAQLGSARIDNTSALMVLNNNSQTPLENIRANLNEWIEDIVRILLDMMGTYYGERPIVRERTFQEPVLDENTQLPMMGKYNGMMQTQQVTRRVIETFDFSKFRNLYRSARVDVGSGNTYSLPAMVQTLDNIRREGILDIVDYLERLPDSLIPKKQELIRKFKAAAAQQGSGTPAGNALPDMGQSQAGPEYRVLQQMNPAKMAQNRTPGQGAPTADDAINALPTNVREQFEQLPPRSKGEVAKIAADRMQHSK